MPNKRRYSPTLHLPTSSPSRSSSHQRWQGYHPRRSSQHCRCRHINRQRRCCTDHDDHCPIQRGTHHCHSDDRHHQGSSCRHCWSWSPGIRWCIRLSRRSSLSRCLNRYLDRFWSICTKGSLIKHQSRSLCLRNSCSSRNRSINIYLNLNNRYLNLSTIPGL